MTSTAVATGMALVIWAALGLLVLLALRLVLFLEEAEESCD